MAIIVPEDRQEDNSGGKRKDNRLTACDTKPSAYGGGTILFPGMPIYTMIWENSNDKAGTGTDFGGGMR